MYIVNGGVRVLRTRGVIDDVDVAHDESHPQADAPALDATRLSYHAPQGVRVGRMRGEDTHRTRVHATTPRVQTRVLETTGRDVGPLRALRVDRAPSRRPHCLLFTTRRYATPARANRPIRVESGPLFHGVPGRLRRREQPAHLLRPEHGRRCRIDSAAGSNLRPPRLSVSTSTVPVQVATRAGVGRGAVGRPVVCAALACGWVQSHRATCPRVRQHQWDGVGLDALRGDTAGRRGRLDVHGHRLSRGVVLLPIARMLGAGPPCARPAGPARVRPLHARLGGPAGHHDREPPRADSPPLSPIRTGHASARLCPKGAARGAPRADTPPDARPALVGRALGRCRPEYLRVAHLQERPSQPRRDLQGRVDAGDAQGVRFVRCGRHGRQRRTPLLLFAQARDSGAATSPV